MPLFRCSEFESEIVKGYTVYHS